MSTLNQDSHNEPVPDVNDVITMKKRRTVQFSHISMLRSYEASQDLNASSWYSSAEMRRFKHQARQERKVLWRMKKDRCYLHRLQHSPHKIDMCTVGLEQQLISSEFTKRRVVSKRLVTLVVLREQARPLSHKADDKPERIAKVSRQHSEWSRAQAQTVGSIQAITRGTRD
eukprot:CAMPEP_0201935022 /NCGR_PEP_ID=MMETSP0903-20130614/34740_1 /ASSEMBLY_ACC=CAM_ASM_000552 /TAXON_ID=420261 /ORGANISM="Thalassiosira antarctica, Strain CCMP982" /LENGTH=170 /DNA_ID=CAMNT_0048475361 /DNA_START=89 /DNA_END=601 /DNA_ORIENTATION=+